MASGLNLGDVAFGLVAETAGLDRALDKLRTFGTLVSKTARSSEDGSKVTAAAFVKQERAILSAFQKVQNLNQAIRQSGASHDMITRNTNTFKSLTNTLSQGELSAQKFARAQAQITARFNETTRALRDYKHQQEQINALQARAALIHKSGIRASVPGIGGIASGHQGQIGGIQSMFTSGDTKGANAAILGLGNSMGRTELKIAHANTTAKKFGLVMRDMERASILAVGPLSGIGARMAVLAALFESTTVKSALFLAGMAGAVIGLGLLAGAAVKTTMKFQQWEAMLVASSGALVLVGEDLQFVVKQSQYFGQSIEGTLPAYAKFAASARLSGLAIADTKNTFTAFMTAAAGLHWTVQQTGNAFVALEQVMSKGTVQTEEIKKQLGNVLPGAFELAAASIGKTTSEFTRLLKTGSIMSNDFIPKFAKMVQAVYAPASERGRISLQADLERLTTTMLLLYKAFDEAIHASDVFQSFVSSINSTVTKLTNNMDEALRVSGAFFAGFVAFTAGGAIWKLGAAFVYLNKVIKESATILAVVSSFFAPEAAILKVILRLGMAAGVGAIAYASLNDATDKAAKSAKSYTSELKETIDMLTKVGEVSEGIKKRLIEQAQVQLATIQARRREAYDLYSNINQSPWAGPNQKEKAEAARDAFFLYERAVRQAERALADLNKLKVSPDPKNTPLDKSLKAQERAQAKINTLRAEYDALVETGDRIQGAINRKVQAMVETLEAATTPMNRILALSKDYRRVLELVAIENEKIADAKALEKANKAIDRYLGNHKAALDAVNKKYDNMREIIAGSGADLERLNTIERMRIEDLHKTMYKMNESLNALHDTLKSVSDDGANALVEMFDGADNAMESFFKNMLKQIELMIVKLYVMKPVMEDIFGGTYNPKIGGGGILGNMFGIGVGAGATATGAGTGAAAVAGTEGFIGAGGAQSAGLSATGVGALATALFALDRYGFGGGQERQMGPNRLVGDFSRSGFTGNKQQSWEQSGGWFGSDVQGSITTSVSNAEQKAFKVTIDSLQRTFNVLGDAIGATSVRTKEWTVSINQAGDVTTALSEGIGLSLVPTLEALRLAGEDLASTAMRVTSAFQSTTQFIAGLGLGSEAAFGALGVASASARISLTEAAGGLDKFNALVGQFVSSILSPAQQLQISLDAVGTTFARLGVVGVETNAQFASLVAAELQLGNFDIVAQLLEVSSAFATVTKDAEDATKALMALISTNSFSTLVDYQRAIGLARGTATPSIASAVAGAAPSVISTEAANAESATRSKAKADAWANYILLASKVSSVSVYPDNPGEYGNYINAIDAADTAYSYWDSLPAFKKGIDRVPYDMTANIHQGEMVVDAASANTMRRYGVGGSSNSGELVVEVRALRQEMQAANVAIAVNTNRTAKILERFDGQGMPEVREI